MKVLYSVQHKDGLISFGLVDDENDLDNVPDDCIAGSRFHVAGYTAAWEKGEDGEWHQII